MYRHVESNHIIGGYLRCQICSKHKISTSATVGSVLVKAPQDPLKTVQKGHPGTADILYSFEGGGAPSKVYKTPSKGRLWLEKVKLLKLCRTKRSYN